MKYKVSIDLSNDAFQGGKDATAIAGILYALADKLMNGEGYEHTTRLRDINGNTVGSAVWAREE
jgi:hypothetical protein